MIFRDYQTDIAERAADLLTRYKIAYLAMQVRTGKTITSLYAASLYGAKHVLFVTKKKAIASIEADYEAAAFNFHISIINYEQLHKFENENFDLVIIDEAHSLGAFPRPSERTKLLKNICAGLPIIYLSGTPSPESYSQLFHQFWVSSFSPWSEYRNFYAWAGHYVTIATKYLYGKTVNDYTNADKESIEAAARHLFITYTQEEAGFQQEIIEEVLTVKMQRGTYWLADKLVKDRLHIGKEGQQVLADTNVKLMQKMQQVYSGTVKFEDGNSTAFDPTKARFIKEHFAGKKIAIFYKFIAERDLLIWEFAGRYTESPEAFNTFDNMVFISQIQSGREGINLSTADALIFFNIDFSYLSYEQGKNRLQSKDRTDPAKVYWIFAENGIEHKIYQRVINKQDYTLSYFKNDFNVRATDPVKDHQKP